MARTFTLVYYVYWWRRHLERPLSPTSSNNILFRGIRAHHVICDSRWMRDTVTLFTAVASTFNHTEALQLYITVMASHQSIYQLTVISAKHFITLIVITELPTPTMHINKNVVAPTYLFLPLSHDRNHSLSELPMHALLPSYHSLILSSPSNICEYDGGWSFAVIDSFANIYDDL